MTATATQLPAPVRRYLRRFELRRGMQRIIRRAGLALVLTLLWALAWCLIDRVMALPTLVRFALVSINGVCAIAIVGGGIGRMLSRVNWVRVARDVERREPAWREKLATVTSRLLGPRQYSGSDALLGALADEVSTDAERWSPGALLPWGPALRPWVASGVIAALGSLLLLVPVLDGRRLAMRYAMPWLEIAPAATTRLFVTPGDIKIAAGDALRVRASAQRLEEGGLTLHLRVGSGPGDDWVEQAMASTLEGAFEARVANLERDADYFVTGGDARSDVFHVTILRRPAVLGFHWTIVYPAYLKLPPRTIHNADGIIQAPLASTARVTIEASEPLAGATINLAGQAIATAATAQANVRQAKFDVRKEGDWTMRMTSTAGVDGQFRGGIVRAIADRPPVVELDGVAVESDKILKLTYAAADDFGLAQLRAELKGTDGRDHEVAIAVTGDMRQQRGIFAVDLASLGLSADDVAEVGLRAEDRAGQSAVSSSPAIGTGEADLAAKASSAGLSPETSPMVDPPEFGESLGAYFRAIHAGR